METHARLSHGVGREMTDLAARSMKVAAKLGSISLGLIEISALVVLIAMVLNSFALLIPAPFLAIAGLIIAILAMVARRTCLHPRPMSPVLGLMASIGAICFFVYWFVAFMSLAGMH